MGPSWSDPRSRDSVLRYVAGLGLFALLLTLLLALHTPPAAQTDDGEMPPVMIGPPLHPAPGWPIWLKDFRTRERTNETSGLSFLGRDADGACCFFLVDDIGMLQYARVLQSGDTGSVTLELDRVRIAPSLLSLLEAHEKWDFEALALELPRPRRPLGRAPPDTVAAMVAVEGRGDAFREETTIAALKFVRTADAHWRVEASGHAFPGATFWHGHVDRNRGIEGLAVGGGCVFLGLEGLESRKDLASRGTILFVYDRAQDRVARLGTRKIGIRSICGLDAIGDSVTVGIDRNAQQIFLLRWDGEAPGRLRGCHQFPLELPAPGGFRYRIPSVEGIAVDDRGDIWCVTDPWSGHYAAVDAAPETVHVYLEAEIPMLYHFDGRPVWQAAGLEHLWKTAPEKEQSGSE